ncbi:MAG TPA: lysylphosphatidylglycerol synthase domain-containing protein [Vicinamibacteria bacterium]|nr:lysylphosphatidylglycerol synthase domain-containing protein [Vicinamibacteria bacterium]
MNRLLRHVTQILPGLLALAFAVFVLRSADLDRVLDLVRSLGWRLPLLLVPNLAVTLVEAVAWWGSFALLGPRPRFASLVGVRLVAEATMLGLPSGAVISESLQPYLLKRRCGVPFEEAVVASAGRKFFVVVSHALVLAVATVLAWPPLERVSRAATGRPGLPWALLAVSAFMAATFGAGLALSGRARVAQRTQRVLRRIGGRWLGPWLDRHTHRFQRADDRLVRFFEAERRALALPLLLYSAGWVVRGVETWLFLRLLGTEIPLLTALVMETAIIVVRSAAVPVPAGLGVQDVGYVLCFRALGFADPITLATAFLVLKRGKDLFWILVGFAQLALGERPTRRSP